MFCVGEKRDNRKDREFLTHNNYKRRDVISKLTAESIKNNLEKTLSKNDITEIEYEAQTNPVFRYYGIRVAYRNDFPQNKILRISDNKNLILIKGNTDTGYDHIIERHNFWSTKIYTKIENNQIVFQNQSRFPKDQYPLLFIKIAEEIYTEENYVKDNSHPEAEKYDLYIGNYSFDSIKSEKVKLLIYKGTKIIHSLFPKSDSHNQKRIKNFQFTRGKVELNKNEVYIPYLDIELKVKFAILIEKDFEKNTENINIITYDLEDYRYHYIQKIGIRKLIKFNSEKSEITTYQFTDLRPIERKIKELNDKLESGEIKLPEN